MDTKPNPWQGIFEDLSIKRTTRFAELMGTFDLGPQSAEELDPAFLAFSRSAEALEPGTPERRLAFLLAELAKRFPGAYRPTSSRAPELAYLEALDKLL